MANHEAASGDVDMGGVEPDITNVNGAVTGRASSTGISDPTRPTNGSLHPTGNLEPKQEADEGNPPSSPADSTKMRSAPKKKGTAATTKKPSKKTKGPRSRRARLVRGGGEGGSSDDDDTDDGPYCLCRGPDDHRWMISCDVCEDWFHGQCVDLDKEIGEKLVERFVCPKCTDGKRHYTKYRKTCALSGCKNPARLYGREPGDRSVFCSGEHCDAWWASMVATLPTKAASKTALEVLTQEDLIGLLVATADGDGWKLGDKPFGNIEGLWSNGLPTRPDVLSEEEQAFLKSSAAGRLALGNEIVQYKKMMQVLDWANALRQTFIDSGRFTKDSCGYDRRLDAVSTRVQFAAWLDSPEGQGVFKAGKLDAPAATDGASDNSNGSDPAIRGTCDRKRCKPHASWYKLLMGVVRVLIKETATAAATKLEAEAAMRSAAEARYERRQLENNYVEVLSED